MYEYAKINECFEEKDPKNTPLGKIMSCDCTISFAGGWSSHYPPEKLRKSYSCITKDRNKFYKSTRYSEVAGNEDFVEQILLNIEKGIFSRNNLLQKNLLVGQGSTEITSALFKILLSEGDGVILMNPHYLNYPEQLFLEEKNITLYEITLIDNNFDYLPDKKDNLFIEKIKDIACKNKIKLIILTIPDNPTGKILGNGLLLELLRFAENEGIFVLIDYAYRSFVYDKEYPEYYKFSCSKFDNLITIHTLSKDFSLPGARVGYLIANFLSETTRIELRQYFRKLQKDYFALFKHTEKCLKENLPECKYLSPDGGFYVVSKIIPEGKNDREFVNELNKETGVLLVPGFAFGSALNNAVRISFSSHLGNTESISEGMYRISQFLKEGSK